MDELSLQGIHYLGVFRAATPCNGRDFKKHVVNDRLSVRWFFTVTPAFACTTVMQGMTP
ncbi:hypothetical protein [Dyella monticola]|uniref:hypothetical protein n=1 Tax=Dyella monticola TaxID=1927958 RepID=UPI0013145C5B|nr:hypothetical protein [Dyella monticola]